MESTLLTNFNTLKCIQLSGDYCYSLIKEENEAEAGKTEISPKNIKFYAI
jgi:hypothetical protein